MTTLEEYKESLEPTDAGIAAEFAKDYGAGQYSNLTKGDYHELLEKLAAELRSPSETKEQSYVRALEKTETGRALNRAMKAAPHTAPGRVEKHVYISEIQKRADEKFAEIRTPEMRFSHAITSSHGRPHDPVAHALYQVAKSAPGRDIPPAAPEAAVDIHKAVADRAGPANAKMLALARARRERFPNETPEQAFVTVWQDPGNGALKLAAQAENAAAWLAGDSTMHGDPRSVERQTYSNPHPGGSGPRPS